MNMLPGFNQYLKTVAESFSRTPILSDTLNEMMQNIQSAALKFAKAHAWFLRETSARSKMASVQIIFTEPPAPELTDRLCENDVDIEDEVLKYYNAGDGAKLSDLIQRCRNSEKISAYQELYDEIIDTFSRQHFHLACIGLFSIIDGVLADATGLLTNTAFIQRLDKIRERLENKQELLDEDLVLFSIYDGIERNQEVFFKGPRFDKEEPSTTVERNWLMHGRTHRQYGKIDVIKILLLLEGIIILADAGEDSTT